MTALKASAEKLSSASDANVKSSERTGAQFQANKGEEHKIKHLILSLSSSLEIKWAEGISQINSLVHLSQACLSESSHSLRRLFLEQSINEIKESFVVNT